MKCDLKVNMGVSRFKVLFHNLHLKAKAVYDENKSPRSCETFECRKLSCIEFSKAKFKYINEHLKSDL